MEPIGVCIFEILGGHGLLLRLQIHHHHTQAAATTTLQTSLAMDPETGIEGVPVGQNQEANEFRRDFTEGSIPLNSENGLITGIVKIPPFHDSYPGNYPIDYKERENTGCSFGWASQVNDQSTLSTPYPNHDALGFPPPQITLMPSENRGASIDLRNSAEPDRHISGFSNLTFATCSDQAAPSQHVGGQAMQSTDHNAFVFPQTQMVSPQEPFPDFTEGSIPLNTENGLIIGSSFGRACQVNDQSTLSTPYPIHDALAFPPPQMTSLPSENWGGSIDLMMSIAPQAEPFSDGQISGFRNFATCFYQAAPSQHVGGQAMQSTDHNAFLFPQTQMVSPQEPSPAGHVFEFSNWNKHTNSVKIKAIYREHTKFKFLFPLTSGIDDLKKEVSKRLNVEVDRFEVKYRDEHGDLISLPFDADWMLCLLSSQGNDEIRVFVCDKDSELL
ncbi:hypothetical protein C3L33_20615, partial [Rhododendron williamsianum]